MRASLLLAWLLAIFSAEAHQNSTAYLFLEQSGSMLKGHWEIPVADLEFAVGLDQNADGEVTWGEIKERLPAIRDYALPRIIIKDASPPSLNDVQVNKRPSGMNIVLLWQAVVQSGANPTLTYNYGFEYDPGHQCIVTIGTRTAVLNKDRRTFEIGSAQPHERLAGFGTFVKVGIFHIFQGIDHICFLLALMLPAVWQRTPHGWEAVHDFRAAFLSIAKIVTAFTVAHSITLALAALRIVILPSVLVESVIALSVVTAALNNLWPLWTERSWMVAFAFGLVHGFGFASALAGLPSGAASLALSLGGFNLGVEIGQLCIVLAFLPLAFQLRNSWFYRWGAVRLGSVGIACVGAVWLVERALQITIF